MPAELRAFRVAELATLRTFPHQLGIELESRLSKRDAIPAESFNTTRGANRARKEPDSPVPQCQQVLRGHLPSAETVNCHTIDVEGIPILRLSIKGHNMQAALD